MIYFHASSQYMSICFCFRTTIRFITRRVLFKFVRNSRKYMWFFMWMSTGSVNVLVI